MPDPPRPKVTARPPGRQGLKEADRGGGRRLPGRMGLREAARMAYRRLPGIKEAARVAGRRW
jgi:hypothetical protein